MSDIFEHHPAPTTPSVRSGRLGGTRPPGLEDPDYNFWADADAQPEPQPPAFDVPEVHDPERPWNGYDKPRLEPPTKVKKNGDWTCPQLGPLCTPGICKEHARFERDKRMKEEREKLEEENRERELKRARNKERRERKMVMSDEERGRGNSDSNNDLGAESDDDDYNHDGDGAASVPSSRTTNPSAPSSCRTNTSITTSRRSRRRPAAVPDMCQSAAWETHSNASNASVPESVWPTESGYSRTPSVTEASATGSDAGARSSVSRRGPRSPATPSTSTSAKGFPTFDNTHWGDPIAMALASEEAAAAAAGKGSKNARRRKDKAKTALALPQVQALETQANEVEAMLVQLPPGGPGSEWGDPDEPW